jgi:hypothetical protein
MGLIGKRQGCVGNPLEIGEGVLQDTKIALESGGNSRLDKTGPHEDYQKLDR